MIWAGQTLGDLSRNKIKAELSLFLNVKQEEIGGCLQFLFYLNFKKLLPYYLTLWNITRKAGEMPIVDKF